MHLTRCIALLSNYIKSSFNSISINASMWYFLLQYFHNEQWVSVNDQLAPLIAPINDGHLKFSSISFNDVNGSINTGFNCIKRSIVIVNHVVLSIVLITRAFKKSYKEYSMVTLTRPDILMYVSKFHVKRLIWNNVTAILLMILVCIHR